jgi:hypothetical protein
MISTLSSSCDGVTTASLPSKCHAFYAKQIKKGLLPNDWNQLNHKEQWIWIVRSYQKLSIDAENLEELRDLLDIYLDEEKKAGNFVYAEVTTLSDNTPQPQTPKPHSGNKTVEPIEWLIFVPSNNACGGYAKAFGTLPPGTQGDIEDAFQKHFFKKNIYSEKLQAEKHDYYATMTSADKRNANVSNNICVAWVVGKKSVNRYLRDIAKGNLWRACDACTNNRRPCARLVEETDDEGQSEVKLCLYPLPDQQRLGVAWDNRAFWLKS